FRGRRLRNDVERVAQHRLVVGADRAHVGAATTAGDHAGAAQDALPQVEAVLGADEILLPRGVRLADDAPDVLGELRKAVRRTEAVARFPIAVPMPHGVARTDLEAACAA